MRLCDSVYSRRNPPGGCHHSGPAWPAGLLGRTSVIWNSPALVHLRLHCPESPRRWELCRAWGWPRAGQRRTLRRLAPDATAVPAAGPSYCGRSPAVTQQDPRAAGEAGAGPPPAPQWSHELVLTSGSPKPPDPQNPQLGPIKGQCVEQLPEMPAFPSHGRGHVVSRLHPELPVVSLYPRLSSSAHTLLCGILAPRWDQ